MQRLFSTFADGCPGIGLLLQRLVIGTALIHHGITNLTNSENLASTGLSLVGAAAGMLLLVGLWTPVAGALAGVVQVWSLFLGTGNLWTSIALATLAAALAMIGPGAWSIDARLFGRKHMEIPSR
jgi:putative oxidoreductase